MFKRWTGMASISIRQSLTHRFEFVMTLVSTLMYASFLYMIWHAVYSATSHPRMPWRLLATYVLVGQAINLARFSPAERAPIRVAAARIRSGDIALDLIRPVGFQTQRFLEAAGLYCVEVIWVNLPTLLLFGLVLRLAVLPSPAAAVGFVASCAIAFVVAFGVNSLLIWLAFWTTNVWGIQILKRGLVQLLAGTLVPFAYFPSWLHQVASWLPFQAMAYLPLSIYLGQVRGVVMLEVLLQQVAWAAVTLAISALAWRHALNRLQISGG